LEKQNYLKGKKLLVLGGSTIGCTEITEYANSVGIYTIVADYLEPENSSAKRIASEHWKVSTADLDELEKRAKEAKIDGVIAGVSEFNISQMILLAERLSLPCYTNMKNWQYCTNKIFFKQMCRRYDVPVTKEYVVDWEKKDFLHIEFPVIVKPADSCASRGFSVCNNENELYSGYENAVKFSESGQVLVEKYMPYPASIIHYTAHNGKLYFAGITDKLSMKMVGKESLVMAIQTMPSKYTAEYLERIDAKARNMFESENIGEGPIWIEAFNNDGDFTFNEMGYRFGGSLTYFPVEYFCGYNQMHMLVEYSLLGKCTMNNVDVGNKSNYCILPIHIRAGKIKEICGQEKVLSEEYVKAVIPVHYVGDEICDWGTAQQVYCYLHLTYENKSDLKNKLLRVKEQMTVLDGNGNNMLFYLFDINELC